MKAEENTLFVPFEKVTTLALENLLNMLEDSEKTILKNDFGFYSLSLEKIKKAQQILLGSSLLAMWEGVKEKIIKLRMPLPALPDDNNVEAIRKWLEENKAILLQIDILFFKDLKIIPPELSYLTGLTALIIHGGKTKDISIFKKLINLEKLWIYENEISDLAPIVNLTNLHYLNLGNNQIIDITSIPIPINLQYIEHNNDLIPIV